jgi:hypothetical protein
MINRKQIALAAGLALASQSGLAAVSDADFQALKEQVAALTRALTDMGQQLEAEKARAAQQPQATGAVAAVPAAAPAKPASSWTEKVTIAGDLRGRYENIDQEGNEDERNRSRIRARAGIVARPQDGLEVGFGLSTSQDNDPVSSNQTIGNGGSRKDIFMDLAYFNWEATEGLNVHGGKFRNNVVRPGKHGLIWDGDLNPEGLGLNYVSGPFFANVLGTWIESDSNESEAFGLGGQAGVNLALGDAARLTAGAGYFNLNTAGKGALYNADDPDFYGNTVDANGFYAYDYQMIEGFAELAFQLVGQPASLFLDYVTNSDADDFDTGWALGAQLGAARAKGTWEASWTYQDLEADAVFGLWTDSDFGGGGTDNKGHVLRGAYALGDKTNVAFSYFINEIGDNAGEAEDYDRLQLDLNFKY